MVNGRGISGQSAAAATSAESGLFSERAVTNDAKMDIQEQKSSTTKRKRQALGAANEGDQSQDRVAPNKKLRKGTTAVKLSHSEKALESPSPRSEPGDNLYTPQGSQNAADTRNAGKDKASIKEPGPGGRRGRTKSKEVLSTETTKLLNPPGPKRRPSKLRPEKSAKRRVRLKQNLSKSKRGEKQLEKG